MKRRLMLGFVLGAAAHLVLWLAAVNFDSTPWDMTCGETSCWVVFAADLPFSILYISGSAAQVSAASLLVGTLWWGLLGAMVALRSALIAAVFAVTVVVTFVPVMFLLAAVLPHKSSDLPDPMLLWSSAVTSFILGALVALVMLRRRRRAMAISDRA